MNSLVVSWGLLVALRQDPDFAKLLEKAKYTLTEAIAKGKKEVPGGKVLSAYLEENDGNPRYFLYIALGQKTVEVALDLKDGTLSNKETLDDDDSKIVSAVKITLEEAIATALKKVPGKAVYADFDVDEKGPPEAEVNVFADGKVTRVLIHAVTGEVLKTEPK
ncbi:MAG TPA: PepSY domain-containing protein [Planctomycetota bacterium]|nr:PepSY domain-containing protein [Planctomycetota bacterium]